MRRTTPRVLVCVSVILVTGIALLWTLRTFANLKAGKATRVLAQEATSCGGGHGILSDSGTTVRVILFHADRGSAGDRTLAKLIEAFERSAPNEPVRWIVVTANSTVSEAVATDLERHGFANARTFLHFLEVGVEPTAWARDLYATFSVSAGNRYPIRPLMTASFHNGRVVLQTGDTVLERLTRARFGSEQSWTGWPGAEIAGAALPDHSHRPRSFCASVASASCASQRYIE